MPRRNARAERLTKRVVQDAKPEAKRYRINDVTQKGFYLFVYPTGRKAFGCRYVTSEGRESETVLGDFPGLTPEVAREQAAKLRSEIRLSKSDPVRERREAKAKGVEQRERTVAALVESYLKAEESRGKKSATTLKKAKGILESSVLPRLGSRPVVDVDHIEIAEALEDIKEVAANRSGKSGAGAANDARKYLLQVFKRGGFLKWITENPMQYIEPLPMKERTVTATEDQLRALWAVWEARKASDDERGRASALALQFLTLTLQRGEEVSSLVWSEVNESRKLWILPEDRKKERRAAAVPLSEPALLILAEARELYPDGVGPFTGRGGEGTIKRNSLTQSFGRDRERLGITNLLPHDLRRTGRTAITNSEGIAMPKHVGELVLNHATGSRLERTYDINDYLPEKRRALEAWGHEVMRIVSCEEMAASTSGQAVSQEVGQ